MSNLEKSRIINMLLSLWLFVMCADLLYLYYAGAWYEPIQWLRKTEVVSLYAIGLFSLAWFVVLAGKFTHER